MKTIRSLVPLLILAGLTALWGQETSPQQSDTIHTSDTLFTWLKQELPAQYQSLRSRSAHPVLQLAYRVDDLQGWDYSADRGAPTIDYPKRKRVLSASIILGSHRFSSSRPLLLFQTAETNGTAVELPLQFSPSFYSRELQQATEWAYRHTRNHYEKLLSEKETLLAEEEHGLDLAPARFAQNSMPPPQNTIDSTSFQTLRQQISSLSNRWKGKPWLHSATLDFSWSKNEVRFLSLEEREKSPSRANSDTIWNSSFRSDELASLSVTLLLRTADGLDLRENKVWSFEKLPTSLDTAAIAQELDSLIVHLQQLKDAPMGEPYAGPVLLEGPAAAVYIHEVLGHRLESHRLKLKSDGQTFLRKRKERVAPPEISLFDDPTLSHWNGEYLHGHYTADDEGVAAQKTTLIEKGVLVGLLNSRTTAIASDSSNGHGRGFPPLSRMGNTILTHSSPQPRDSLRQMLLQIAKERGLPYALSIQELQGGYTITSRELPQSFQLLALSAKRIWVDGRPDELLRGINISGSPLSSLSYIVGASDQTSLFNGYCGAENGWVPVSAISPDLLFSTMEAEIQPTRSGALPLLSPPEER